ncbi:MAG TPA: hypothetical protein VGE29_02445 [Prosthecobacter sp.]
MRLLLLLCLLLCSGEVRAEEKWAYLDNGQVRLGVNLDAGACIGWFSASGSQDNLLNAYDVGRYVQQSYYGDPDGSDWNGKLWRYNPVQGGSWRNQPAQVTESRVEKDLLYARISPRHWATGKLLSEVVLEQWLRLDGQQARLKFKMRYQGEKTHQPHHQELPALFVNPEFDTLVFAGADGQFQRKQPGFPNEYFKRGPEPWVAWVNERDRGVGLHIPHAEDITAYRVRHGNRGDCSYLAPIQTFSLKPGLVFEYEVSLAIGSLDEFRQWFVPAKQP